MNKNNEKHEGVGANYRDYRERLSACGLEAETSTTGNCRDYRDPASGGDGTGVFEVLRDLGSAGARLWADGDSLKLQAPRDIPPELVSQVRASKATLLAALARQAEASEAMRRNPRLATEDREVCVESPWGRVWIGPVRSGQDRLELTWQELHDDPEGALAHCRQVWDAIRLFEGKVLAGRNG